MNRLYIQSKSGDFNAILPSNAMDELDALIWIRSTGGYPAKYRGVDVVVPFEEILYVRKAREDEKAA
jgi:hypothetical protein